METRTRRLSPIHWDIRIGMLTETLLKLHTQVVHPVTRPHVVHLGWGDAVVAHPPNVLSRRGGLGASLLSYLLLLPLVPLIRRLAMMVFRFKAGEIPFRDPDVFLNVVDPEKLTSIEMVPPTSQDVL